MRRDATTVLIALIALSGCHQLPHVGAPNTAAAARPCAVGSMPDLSAVGARVVSATTVPAGGFTPPRATRPIADLPAFCRVQAVATPTSASLITFEVWVPDAAAWNGKLVATGNGGFSPALSYGDMASALRSGYATVGGDTGHQTTDPNDLSFGVGNRERIIDWGTRSIHAITEPAKRIVAALDGYDVRRSYFNGCSTGGHQGYAAIQRYPADFDGVIAGAPGNDRVRLTAGFLWQFIANHERGGDGAPILPAAKLPTITRAVVAACDSLDGIRDGVVDDPRACKFDPGVLRCSRPASTQCLTDRELAALSRMYGGAHNPRTGAQVYPGWPIGSEAPVVGPDDMPLAGWHAYWGTDRPARADFWRLWVFQNPQWDWWTFDFDGDLARADSILGSLVDQRNADISAFARRGGKAIVYHGWQDPVASVLGTIAYYDSVRAHQGSQAATDAFFRLFLVPGMGHCAGGSGATTFGNQGAPSPSVDADHDLLAALDRWVERGVAPDRIIASRVVDGVTTRTRPLCPYPRRAIYRGSGSTDDASSFICR